MTLADALSALASIATAVGVAVAAYQLLIARQQALTSFEDSLNSQYRAVIERLPLEALFGEPVAPVEIQTHLPTFYRYFDLCNEQAFLHKHGRISTKTWRNWEEGIKTNMSRQAFARAWSEIATRAKDDFDYLRQLCPPRAIQGTDAA
jgi:hypothetical protein